MTGHPWQMGDRLTDCKQVEAKTIRFAVSSDLTGTLSQKERQHEKTVVLKVWGERLERNQKREETGKHWVIFLIACQDLFRLALSIFIYKYWSHFFPLTLPSFLHQPVCYFGNGPRAAYAPLE